MNSAKLSSLLQGPIIAWTWTGGAISAVDIGLGKATVRLHCKIGVAAQYRTGLVLIKDDPFKTEPSIALQVQHTQYTFRYFFYAHYQTSQKPVSTSQTNALLGGLPSGANLHVRAWRLNQAMHQLEIAWNHSLHLFHARLHFMADQADQAFLNLPKLQVIYTCPRVGFCRGLLVESDVSVFWNSALCTRRTCVTLLQRSSLVLLHLLNLFNLLRRKQTETS